MKPVDAHQVDAVVTAARRILGTTVLGIYQYGSTVAGHPRPMSDLDFLVVVDRPTAADQRRDLVVELLEFSGRRGTRIAGRPVELTVVRHDKVKPWRAPAEREFQFGEWLRDAYESGLVPAPEADHDLAPLLFTALNASKALAGPPLGNLIDPIPTDDLVAAMRAGVPSLMHELADDTRNVLLTLARMWYTTSTGDILTKDAAAGWALDRMPAGLHEPLAHARFVYLGEAIEAFGQIDVSPVATADFMAAEIMESAVR